MPDEPEVLGLLAAILLTESRRRARTTPDGRLVLNRFGRTAEASAANDAAIELTADPAELNLLRRERSETGGVPAGPAPY